jgi:hypothetical protein
MRKWIRYLPDSQYKTLYWTWTLTLVALQLVFGFAGRGEISQVIFVANIVGLFAMSWWRTTPSS